MSTHMDDPPLQCKFIIQRTFIGDDLRGRWYRCKTMGADHGSGLGRTVSAMFVCIDRSVATAGDRCSWFESGERHSVCWRDDGNGSNVL